jgi:hypothetical protein
MSAEIIKLGKGKQRRNGAGGGPRPERSLQEAAEAALRLLRVVQDDLKGINQPKFGSCGVASGGVSLAMKGDDKRSEGSGGSPGG